MRHYPVWAMVSPHESLAFRIKLKNEHRSFLHWNSIRYQYNKLTALQNWITSRHAKYLGETMGTFYQGKGAYFDFELKWTG